jgi:hypothetical protein
MVTISRRTKRLGEGCQNGFPVFGDAWGTVDQGIGATYYLPGFNKVDMGLRAVPFE